jgi:hypothetical protein
MEADEILTRAKSSDGPPHGWIVLTLVRRQVITGIVGWVFGIFIGLGLFVAVAFTVIPNNYQHGATPAVLTSLFLGILLFIGLGSLWSTYVDTRRLIDADRQIIVITPDDFVKQEGNKVIHVPLANVRHVTARGTPPPDPAPSGESAVRQVSGVGENLASFFMGRSMAQSVGRSGSRRS